eukprot:3877584-Rhodomonas_salina.1
MAPRVQHADHQITIPVVPAAANLSTLVIATPTPHTVTNTRAETRAGQDRRLTRKHPGPQTCS